MADSEWESIRKKFNNLIIYWIGIGIPVLLLGGFFIYNNWDIINNTDSPKEYSKKIDTDEIQHSDTLSAEITSSADSSGIVQVAVDVVPPQSDKVPTAVSEAKKVKTDKGIESQSETKTIFIEETVSYERTVSSLTLPSIRCHISDRNELLLLLSVQLLSDYPVLQSKIQAMRDEFRVIIQKIIRSRELSALNKELLKTEIIKSVNGYIGSDVFKDLKFTEFKIEKVIKK